MLHLLVAGLVATVVIVESDDVCPTEPPRMMYACLPVPKCSGDASCGVGQGCCPHTCGARCATLGAVSTDWNYWIEASLARTRPSRLSVHSMNVDIPWC
ncbi:WAP four-disulfide core domain protein 18-like isoform X3 [Haliotis rufescens]|uniref:WAP four-disulfide core domain protein 18-like isoform X3 n=1 Tax=Haliotis rufescens TaxID=6454 RepID=UPI00201F25B9|nr:WAP four-disulfide core domain protein 18-like isoform X3 [Haliotis rufescens]